MTALHQQIVDIYPYATVAINRAGTVLLFNPAAENLFGYSKTDVLGKLVDMLVPEDRLAKHIAGRERFFKEPMTVETPPTLEGLRADGSRFWCQIKLSPAAVPDFGMIYIAVIRRVKPGIDPDPEIRWPTSY